MYTIFFSPVGQARKDEIEIALFEASADHVTNRGMAASRQIAIGGCDLGEAYDISRSGLQPRTRLLLAMHHVGPPLRSIDTRQITTQTRRCKHCDSTILCGGSVDDRGARKLLWILCSSRSCFQANVSDAAQSKVEGTLI